MKVKTLALALFVAGLTASLALAGGPPPGKGHGNGGAPDPAAGTTAAASVDAKVTMCHKTGSKKNPWVKITVSRSSVKAHTRKGDSMPDATGACAAAAAATTTTATTATTAGTTTGTTTG
jgi:hypothetical protein